MKRIDSKESAKESGNTSVHPAAESGHPKTGLSKIAQYIIFLALAAVILLIGLSQFRRYSRNFEAAAMDELSSIARLKADQLTQWRKERLLDAAGLDQNIFISVLVGRSIQAPTDAGTQRRLQAWLQKYRNSGIYDRIQVLDRQGTAKLSLPEGISPVPPAVLQQIPDIFRTGRAEIVDFYLDSQERRPFLNLLIPVFADGALSSIAGILSLRIDPASYLYPFIQQWPTSSRTAETLIVRRDGPDVLYLNDTRFKKNSALNLRIPLAERPIAALAIEGREGIVTGIDYRRENVFGFLAKIPDSPWFLVARIDKKEILGPIRERLLWNLGILTVLLIALGLGFGTIQRKQKVRVLRERLAAARNLRAISSRQEALLSALPEIIMEVDQNKIYVWANPPGLEFFGDGVIGKEASFYFEGEQDTYKTVRPVFDGIEDVIYVESWQRRRDGQKRLLGWWCRSLKDPDGRTTGAISTARDITEERLFDESRREVEARYRTLVDNAPIAILVNRDSRVVLANDACLRLFGATSPDQLLGKSPFELFHPDCHALIRERIGRLQATGIAVPMLEEKIVRLDGTAVDVEVTAAPFLDRGTTAIHVVLADITERKRAEDRTTAALSALRESEAIFDQFMMNCPVYMFFKDEKIRAIRLSANYKDMLGLPVEDALGKTMDDLFPSALAKRMIADDLRILKEGEVATVDEELNGRYYTTIKFPIKVEGKPRYLAGFTIDITERKLAEDRMKAALKELQASEEKFRKAFLTSPDAININRLSDGMYISINKGFTQTMGYADEDVAGRTSAELNIWAEPDDRRRLVEGLRAKGYMENLEARFRRKNGEIGVGLMSAAMIEIDQVPHILSITHDITERKQAETALKQSEKKLRSIFENVQDLYFETAMDGTILDVSPSIGLISGNQYRREDLIGRMMADYYGGPVAREDLMKNLLEWGHVDDYEITLRNRDGTSVPCSLAARIVFDSQGRPEKLVGSIRNIAERKRAADQAKAAFEAQASSLREKELLLQEVHHRVKNNLQIISSLLNLEAERVSPEVRELIKRSQTRIRSLSLVHEKLYRAADLTRIDLAGYIESLAGHLFQVYVVDPDKVRLVTDFQDVSLDINSAIPCGLILNELISNALKHAFPGKRKGVLTIRMKRTREDFVELHVSDDGIGLPDTFDLRDPKSFGFQIMNLLIDQLEADFAVDRKRGTTFTLKFRELKYKPRI
ncbi:MAG: PAS domain S-box protein [Candidatus Aminicenantales bacterium]